MKRSPGRYQELDLFIKVLRLLCPNLTDAVSKPFVVPHGLWRALEWWSNLVIVFLATICIDSGIQKVKSLSELERYLVEISPGFQRCDGRVNRLVPNLGRLPGNTTLPRFQRLTRKEKLWSTKGSTVQRLHIQLDITFLSKE